MEKHPMAGKPIKVTGGRYKGSIFTPIDFLINQFQGKKIENIRKGHGNLFYMIPESEHDDQLVFGELYGVDKEHNRVVIHNKHLIKEVQDATTGPSDSDNQADVAGGPESDGCSLSSDEVHGENVLQLNQEGQADRLAGSGDIGPEAEHPRSSEHEAEAPRGTSKSEARRLRIQRDSDSENNS